MELHCLLLLITEYIYLINSSTGTRHIVHEQEVAHIKYVKVLTASCFLISAIFAITFAIAQLRFVNALGHSVSTATRTQEFIIWTGNRRTIHLIAVI